MIVNGRLGVATIIVVALAGCQSSDSATAYKPKPGAYFRVVNLTDSPFQYLLDGQAGPELNPKSGQPFVLRRPKSLPFILKTASGEVALEQSVDLPSGKSLTLVLHGAKNPPEVTLIEDEIRDPGKSTDIAARVVNFGAQAAEGKVTLGTTDHAFSLEPKTAAKPILDRAASIALVGSVSGKKVTASVEPNAGDSYSFFLVGNEVVAVHNNPRMQINVTGSSRAQ